MIDITIASVEEAVRILPSVAHGIPVLTSCQLDALASAAAPSNFAGHTTRSPG